MISILPVFSATLWDFVIYAKFEQNSIKVGEKPVITGTVLDHALKPISGADVKIRFADNVGVTTTDKDGNFRYEFTGQVNPGTFLTNISAKVDDLKSFTTTTLVIGDGHGSFEDMYYKKDYVKMNNNDPYKSLKEKQYQKHIEKQQKIKQKQNEIESKKITYDEKRNISMQKRAESINATQVGAGIYSGNHEHVTNIDPRIKNIITEQITYTKQAYEEAQYAMKKILEQGGSLQDAKKAYFEKLATSREKLESIGANNTENYSKIKEKDSKINSKKVKGLTLNKNLK